MPLGNRSDCGDAKYVGVLVPFPIDRSVDRTLQVGVVGEAFSDPADLL